MRIATDTDVNRRGEAASVFIRPRRRARADTSLRRETARAAARAGTPRRLSAAASRRCDVAERPPAGGNVEHCSDEESDHVMQGIGWLRSRIPARQADLAIARMPRDSGDRHGQAPCRVRRSPGSSDHPRGGRPLHPERPAPRAARMPARTDHETESVPRHPCRRSSCTVGLLHCSARETRPASRRPPRPTHRCGRIAFNARRNS